VVRHPREKRAKAWIQQDLEMLLGTNDHPFYKPLWRRIAIVAVTAGWALFEFYTQQSGLWIGLATAVCLYSIWTFLITFPKS
jgi:hypothetical protein